MSNFWLNRAYATPLKLTQKTVLVALADYADDEGVCFPSNATLALKCGVCDRTIRRVKTDLIELGYLRLIHRTGRSCLYQLCMPEEMISAEKDVPASSTDEVEGRTDCPIRADSVSSITIIEPSLSTTNEPSTPPTPHTAASGAVCDAGAMYAVKDSKEQTVVVSNPQAGLPMDLPIGLSAVAHKQQRGVRRQASSQADDVQTVFEYWKQVMSHPRSGLDKKRRRVIAEALKLYSVEDLKKAVDGCRASPFHMGDNDRNRPFNKVELIFRDADKIDTFIDFSDHPPVNRAKVMTASDQSMAWAQAMDRLTGNAPATDEDDVVDLVKLELPC